MENIFSLLFVGHIFLLFSMPSDFILDGVHCHALCCGGSGCHCLHLKSVDVWGRHALKLLVKQFDLLRLVLSLLRLVLL